jgi:hypothetical protein
MHRTMEWPVRCAAAAALVEEGGWKGGQRAQACRWLCRGLWVGGSPGWSTLFAGRMYQSGTKKVLVQGGSRIGASTSYVGMYGRK